MIFGLIIIGIFVVGFIGFIIYEIWAYGEKEKQRLQDLDNQGLKEVCNPSGYHMETHYRYIGKVMYPYHENVTDYSCKMVPK